MGPNPIGAGRSFELRSSWRGSSKLGAGFPSRSCGRRTTPEPAGFRGSKNVESAASQPPKARVHEMGSRSIARGREGAILPPPDCQTRAPTTCTILRSRFPTVSATVISVVGERKTSSPARRTSTCRFGEPISAAAESPAPTPSPTSSSFSRRGGAAIRVTAPRRSQAKVAFTLTATCICPCALRSTERPAGKAVRLARPLNGSSLRGRA